CNAEKTSAAEHRRLGRQHADAAAASRAGIERHGPDDRGRSILRGSADELLSAAPPLLPGLLLPEAGRLLPPSASPAGLAPLVTALPATGRAPACSRFNGTRHAGRPFPGYPQFAWRR